MVVTEMVPKVTRAKATLMIASATVVAIAGGSMLPLTKIPCGSRIRSICLSVSANPGANRVMLVIGTPTTYSSVLWKSAYDANASGQTMFYYEPNLDVTDTSAVYLFTDSPNACNLGYVSVIAEISAY